MKKPALPAQFEINLKPDGIKVTYCGNILPNLPRLTRVILRRRFTLKAILSQRSLFPFIYYFYPEVRAAKRMLRKQFGDEKTKMFLMYYNDTAIFQTVYSNPIVQAYFQFALMYVHLDSLENNRPESIKKAMADLEAAKKVLEKTPKADSKKAKLALTSAKRNLARAINAVLKKAKTAFHHSSKDALNISDNGEKSRSQRIAKEIFDFAFQSGGEFVLVPKILRAVGSGKKEGVLRKDTKDIHDFIERGFSDREIAVILYYQLDPLNKAEIEKRVAEIRRQDDEVIKKAARVKQIRSRRNKKLEITKQKSEKKSVEK